MLCKLCFEGTDLTEKEKSVLNESMSMPVVRNQTTDFFLAFMSPRNIHNEKCLETIGQAVASLFDCILEEDLS